MFKVTLCQQTTPVKIKKSRKISKVKAIIPLFIVWTIFAHPSDLKASINIVLNGDFETGDLLGWTTTSPDPSVVLNGTFEIESFGSYFYRAGQTPFSEVEQTIDISDLSSGIDLGVAVATLSGYLGSWSNDDIIVVEASFFNSLDEDLGNTISISAIDNPLLSSGSLGLTNDGNLETTIGDIPVGARSIIMKISSERTLGSDNDGYADNLSSIVSVPEPSTYALLLGASVLGYACQRRRK